MFSLICPYTNAYFSLMPYIRISMMFFGDLTNMRNIILVDFTFFLVITFGGIHCLGLYVIFISLALTCSGSQWLASFPSILVELRNSNGRDWCRYSYDDHGFDLFRHIYDDSLVCDPLITRGPTFQWPHIFVFCGIL